MTTAQLDERHWVRQARAGDRGGMERLLSAYSTPAFRLALQILRNQPDAEDATQAAFVKAFANIKRFDPERPFRPWLLGIVSHEALNLRRADRTRFAFWRKQVEKGFEEGVEDVALVRAEHRELWSALNRLKDDDRVVLILTYLVGLSEIETAEALGIKRGTVKSRKHNALSRLRSLVEREFPGLWSERLLAETEGRPR